MSPVLCRPSPSNNKKKKGTKKKKETGKKKRGTLFLVFPMEKSKKDGAHFCVALGVAHIRALKQME